MGAAPARGQRQHQVGTNEVHGVLFNILQNDKVNANRWEYNKADAPAAVQTESVRLGPWRPTHQERLFMFGDYQGTKIRSFAAASRTSAMAASTRFLPGDGKRRLLCVARSAVGTGALGNTILANQVFDPRSQRTVNDSSYAMPSRAT